MGDMMESDLDRHVDQRFISARYSREQAQGAFEFSGTGPASVNLTGRETRGFV
jgi:hypothetical protein